MCNCQAEIAALRELPAHRFKRAVLALIAGPEAEPSRVRAREARASLSLSDDSKKEVLEREDDSLPRAWAEAAEREREHLAQPAVRLEVEWRKAVLWYAEHNRELSIGGWLRWAVRAWLDKTNAPIAERSKSHAASAVPKTGQPPAPLVAAGEAVREEIRQRAELRFFFEAARWSEQRQGPRPGEAGCRYPAALIAEAQQRFAAVNHLF